MEKVLVTIVIASFNSAKTISKALQSVKEQNFQDWECLVIDGASKDNTISIVREYAERDSRFRYISEPDKGIYDAFNKGWKNARGEWIYYLGSDDWLTNDGLELLTKEIDDKSAILSGDIIYTRLNGSEKRMPSGNPRLGGHQGMITRRSIIEKYDGFDERFSLHADHELVIRIINDNFPMKLVHVVVAHFSIGGASQNIGSIITSTREKLIIYKKFKALKHPTYIVMKSSTRKMVALLVRSIKNKLFNK